MSMASLRRGLARVPAWVVDAGWAVAVALAVTIAIRVAREPGARAPDLLAYALGWTLGALLLARRWPVAVRFPNDPPRSVDRPTDRTTALVGSDTDASRSTSP